MVFCRFNHKNVSNLKKVTGVKRRPTLVSGSDGWHRHQWVNKTVIIFLLNDKSRVCFLTCHLLLPESLIEQNMWLKTVWVEQSNGQPTTPLCFWQKHKALNRSWFIPWTIADATYHSRWSTYVSQKVTNRQI